MDKSSKTIDCQRSIIYNKGFYIKIYNDYNACFPECSISEEQLKSHVRKEKESLKTGVADDTSGKVLVPPADIIEQIRQGDRHASRNILAERSRKLVTSESPAPPKNKEGASNADSVDIRPVKMSKAHCLQQQIGYIA